MSGMPKRNIGFLLGSLNRFGGIDRAVSILMNELQQTEQYNIHALCYYQADKQTEFALHPEITMAIILDQPSTMRKAIIRVIRYLIKYIRAHKIERLIACGAVYFPAAVLAGQLTGCRVICSDHSNYTSNPDVVFELQARNFAARYSDDLILLTAKDIQNYQQNTKVNARIDFIPNIVDRKLFEINSKYDTTSRKILSVGRLNYAKNYELLIDIAAEVLAKHPDWSWDIYGGGELHDSLQAKIDALEVDRLTLKGTVSDIYAVYPNYAFFVMTSRYEGYPMVLLEAIANKVPVLAFDINTGPSDIIDHMETGWLIEPGDVPAMTAAIERMITDAALRVNMSANCNEAIKKFSTADIINKWGKYLT